MSTYILSHSGELYHYGVKGMKWGVRRYQNADGTLTSAGRKNAKQEYKADNKTAYELGKTATIYGHAAAKSMNRTVKLENKLNKRYEKDPNSNSRKTASLNKKLDASSKTTAELTKQYMESKAKAEKHCKSLIDKYGKEAVSSIKYTDLKVKNGKHGSPTSVKTMNEKTTNMKDVAAAGAKTMLSISMSVLMGHPIHTIYTPATTGQKAAQLENTLYKDNVKQQKRERK